ncbi:MAG: cellulase family glycosylhydrolase [Verrucomicrobiota bacterium]|nr:cellulase family glycosylhydrolase [Verrucomicrobiota bacterium]
MIPNYRVLIYFFITAASVILLIGPNKVSLANKLSIQQSTNNADQIELEWPSQSGNAYRIYQRESLNTAFTVQADNLEATPPKNIWWADKAGYEMSFFKVQEYPPEIITNYDFSAGKYGWNTPVNAANAIASINVIDGELSVDITNGGSAVYHIFLRQLGIPFVENQTYTLLFDARASATRNIRLDIRDVNTNTSFLNTNITISNVDVMQTYRLTFTATSPYTANGRLTFLLGNNDNSLYLDNIHIVEGTENIVRTAAHHINSRLFRGNNFMAAKAMNDQGALEDYSLLRMSGFNHCRIGYKMDEVAGVAPNYTVPNQDLLVLQKMVDWCLLEGLIAVVDPVHNWANNNNVGQAFAATEEEYNKLGKIWEQVAGHFANYDIDSVVFEVFNEPHNGHDVARIISTSLAAIRSNLGNEERIVIVPGDGFSTRQALIDAFNNDEIPSDDPYLIGTFHYYDPFSFTKISDSNYNPVWGITTELEQVATDFDAVVDANNNWATRNLTEPLPIYLGEFGVDNEADSYGGDRKKWLSWIRMQAEARGMSWAHWNMYQNQPANKGMGEWTYGPNGTVNNPSTRAFDRDPVEALVGHYEFENGSPVGGPTVSQQHLGFMGSGYIEFPETTGNGIFIRTEDLYIPVSGTYAVRIHYSSNITRTLRVVSGNLIDGNFAPTYAVGSAVDQVFPATGPDGSWETQVINLYFEAGVAPQLKIVANTEPGVNLDWLEISLPQP